MKASTMRRALQLMPFDKQTIKPFYRRLRPLLSYPPTPTIVDAKYGTGAFEIRQYEDAVQRNIYFFGYWERKETRLVIKLLRPGDVFVDIGANIGWFTVLGSRCVGPEGRVFSFEPAPENYDNLQANIRLNALTNVTTENLAISDTAGIAILSGFAGKHVSRGTIVRGSDRDGHRVTSVPFDMYWRTTGRDRIRLLKMDIEGAEVKALAGMKDLLTRQTCDYLLIEVCRETLNVAGTDPSNLLAPLERSGYVLYEITHRGPAPLGSIPETGHINVLAARSVEDLQSREALAPHGDQVR